MLWLEHGVAHLGHDAGHPSRGDNWPRLLWWPVGSAAELLVDAGTRGSLLSIPRTTMLQALPIAPISQQMQRTLSQPVDLPAEKSIGVAALFSGLDREKRKSEAGSEIAILHYLSLLLLQLWRMARQDLVAPGGAPQGLSERFILLAAQYRRGHRAVADYASDLGVSRDRLGSAVRRATGISPQAYLHKLLVRDAAELLKNTGMPISQVAFRLGFADPAYFTRFFKRETGQSPGAYRKSTRRSANEGQVSFSAWP